LIEQIRRLFISDTHYLLGATEGYMWHLLRVFAIMK